MTCTPEALSPYTRDAEAWDPVPATTPQKQFEQRLRGVLGRINARLREAIVSNDVFGLRDDTEALVDDVPQGVFETNTRRAAIVGFLEWVRRQLDDHYLTIVAPDRNQFLRQAYAQGVRNVVEQLQDAEIAVAPTDMDSLLGRPFHRSELQTLYTRTYENLVSVRDDTAQAVRDELVEGFREGESPTKIAQRLTDRVNSIGKHRSTMIARSETMNAYSSGTLQRVRELNQERETTPDGQVITSHGEWDAAMGQPNTCPFCRAINGTPLTPGEMATTTVQFRGDVYRLKPPAHVHGRCNIDVRIGPGEITQRLAERLPAEVTVIT